MKTLNLVQGSQEWLSVRAAHFCASDAPAMLGLSKYQTRDALLRSKKTGIAQEVDASTQRIFDRGHELEEMARPIAEKIIGDDLYPATGVVEIDGLKLLASFDGITMLEDQSWEHKSYNEQLAECLKRGEVPATHWPQIEHQMIVAGTERVLFMISNGTEETELHVWYESVPGRRQQLIDGWKQFAKDLEAYVVQDIKPEVVAQATEALPAVFVQVNGSLAVSDNLKAFGERLQAFVESINKTPETDLDFANCEEAIKTLEKAESALKQAKASAIEQIAPVADMQRLIDLNHDLARSNRLALEKIVKAEKENRKTRIVQDAQQAFASHVAQLNTAIGKSYMPAIPVDFAGAIKGLKSIDSIKNAADTELARAKIAANDVGNKIVANMASLRELAADYAFLFADTAQIVLKQNDDLVALIKARISEHKEAEEKRIFAERERIRAEEAAKLQRAIEAEEAARVAEEKLAEEKPTTQPVALAEVLHAVVPAPIADALAPPTLKLGQICDRLGFGVTADFLQSIGFPFAKKDRAACLYHEHDFPRICAAIIKHVTNVMRMPEAA